GTISFADAIDPACQLAEQGLPVDWYSAGKINAFARGLASYEETRRVYLADGLPPAASLEGEVQYLPLGQLGQTYRRLQSAGAEDFYSGQLAESMARDLQAVAGSGFPNHAERSAGL
ncbi:MAG: gamma-glutamyltransferase, partial [Pseudomonadales bacterium]|nr:gamma-glutamyltransferase [Pseudomonadales bacterium]